MKVIELDSCTSVLDVAWPLLKEKQLDCFDAVLTKEQTAGRGQYGRQWVSPKGNMYAGVRLPYVAPFNHLGAALAISNCLVKTLNRFGFFPKIKWMNDIVLNEKKVAGLLLEQKGDDLIVGIGLNIASHPQSNQLREQAALQATSLQEVDFEKAKEITPRIFLDQLLDVLNTLDLTVYENTWRKEAQQHLLWLQEKVVLTDDDKNITGVLVGVDEQGALELFTQTGQVLAMRGSIRKATK